MVSDSDCWWSVTSLSTAHHLPFCGSGEIVRERDADANFRESPGDEAFEYEVTRTMCREHGREQKGGTVERVRLGARL